MTLIAERAASKGPSWIDCFFASYPFHYTLLSLIPHITTLFSYKHIPFKYTLSLSSINKSTLHHNMYSDLVLAGRVHTDGSRPL